jgi:hypothetical protein
MSEKRCLGCRTNIQGTIVLDSGQTTITSLCNDCIADIHSGRRRLNNAFAGLDRDMMNAFFTLDERDLELVFSHYSQEYGIGAAKYARESYPHWRQGAKNPSRQTYERLMAIVPQVLNFDTKVRLYRRLRDAHRQRERIVVRVAALDDLLLVEEAAKRIVERSRSGPVPADVHARLTWLSRGDGVVAGQLVAVVEEREGEMVAVTVRKELRVIYEMVTGTAVVKNATHEIELPYGTITVDLAKKRGRWTLSDERGPNDANLPARRQDILPARPARDIIDFALQQHEAPEEIIVAAQHEGLRLAAKQREGQIDSANANRELGEFIEQAHALNRQQGLNFEAEADFKRASGKTHVRVKKQKRWWWPFG